MEFLADSNKVRSLTSAHHVWLTISPDFSSLTILMVFDSGKGDVEMTCSIPIIEASFEKIIREIEQMICECTLQD
jgi:hypothetical protein